MLFQAGGFIVSLLLWQVTDILGQSKTDMILQEVSEINDKLDKRDKLCEDKFAELKQVVESLVEKVSDKIRDSLVNQDACVKGQPHINGTKRVTLWGNTTALCDTTTDGGGWIIIQRRTSDEVDFYRGWKEYRDGFGNLDTNFWLGNNAIHRLADQGYNELRVEIIYKGSRYYAQYSNFYVAGEETNYVLTVGKYEGTAGNSLATHDNKPFSTFDRDNDKSGYNCAELYKGAWWYNACHYSNLNGLWGVDSTKGVAWYATTGWNSVSFTEMKIRRS